MSKRSFAFVMCFVMLMGVGAVFAQEVTISDISITPASISPDNDGTADRAIIRFSVSKTQAQPWEHIEAGVIINIDGDEEYEAPNWEEYNWMTTFPDDFMQMNWRPLEVDLENTGEATFSVEWEGRDARRQVLPNSSYNLLIAVVQSRQWNEETSKFEMTFGATTEVYDAGELVGEPLQITVATAGISGTVTDLDQGFIANARVSAGNSESWGEAITDRNGEYTISGLAAGDFHVNVQAEGYVNEDYMIGEQHAQVTVEAGLTTEDIDFALQPALSVPGTILLVDADDNAQPYVPRQSLWGDWFEQDLWININAWSPMGGKGTWGNAVIHGLGETTEQGWYGWDDQNEDSDGNGRDDIYYAHDDDFWIDNEIADNESDFATVFTLDLEPGTYVFNAESQGYASVQTLMKVDEDGSIFVDTGGDKEFDESEEVDSLEIKLKKAGSVSAVIKIAEELTQNNMKWIEFSAESADGRSFAWGGGQFDPNFVEGYTTGRADIRSILPGTYTAKIRVHGYKPYKEVIVVTEGGDVVLEGDDHDTQTPIVMSQGNTISGTITLNDDDREDSLNVDVNVWSQETHVHGWTRVELNEGNEFSADYTIGGLELGDGDTAVYNIDIWFPGQYEVTPRRHRQATLTASDLEDIDFALAPFSGVLSGDISVSAGSVDYTEVLVLAKDPERWDTFLYAQPNPQGEYVLDNLGTGEYVISVNEYENVPQWLALQEQQHGGGGDLHPAGTEDPQEPFDIEAQFLQPTGNFGGITIRLSIVNGDEFEQDFELDPGCTISGTFAAADGYEGEFDPEDFVGGPVVAFPLEMRFMGMGVEAMSVGLIEETSEGSGVFGYTISGLGEGAFLVQPPSSAADSGGEGEHLNPMDSLFDNQNPDVAVESKTAFCSAADPEVEVDFTYTEGFTISGTITIPGKINVDLEGFDEFGSWDNDAKTQFLQQFWVGEINVYRPEHHGGNRHKSLMAADFYDETSGQFKKTADYRIEHMKAGKYVVEVHTPRYMTAARNITIEDADVGNVDFQITKGASITGRLVNAETGEAVTGADGVWVECEARPWKPGSWRSTNQKWGMDEADTRIDGDEALQDDDNDTLPGNFYLTNLPGGNYVVRVRTESGAKSGGAKNYASATYAGVVVPEGSTDAVDMDVIQLVEGVTISGTVMGLDPDTQQQVPLGNIRLFAEPADRGSSAGGVDTSTDEEGNYIFYGIDPRAEYYDVICAERPEMFDFIDSPWAGKERFNVEPGDTGVDFLLEYANSTLTGTVEKDDSETPFALPFEDAGDFPAAMILLQKEGLFYEPMDGIEVLTNPSDSNSTTFTVRSLAAGVYNLFVFNRDLVTTGIVVEIEDGENELEEPIVLSSGGMVSGTVRKGDGTRFTTGDIGMVVAMPPDMTKLAFGSLVSNPSTREVDTYEVKGLEFGIAYRIMFIQEGDEGPEKIYPTETPVTVTAESPEAEVNYEIAPKAGDFIANVYRNDDDNFEINVFCSEVIAESEASDVLELLTGAEDDPDGVQGQLYDLVMGTDKMIITAIYSPDDADEEFAIKAIAHDMEGASFSRKFTFPVNLKAKNQATIPAALGGKVNVGKGDSTEAQFPQGAIEDGNGDGEAEAEIAALAGEGGGGAAKAGPKNGEAQTIVADRGTSALSDVYQLSLSELDTLADDATFTLAVEFDTDQVGSGGTIPTTDIDLFYYNATSDEWEKVTEGRTVTDEEGNHKLAAQVASLGQYAIYQSKGLPAPTVQANQDYQLDFEALGMALTIPGDVLNSLANLPEITEKTEAALVQAILNYKTLAASNLTEASAIVDIPLEAVNLAGQTVTVKIPINTNMLLQSNLALYHFTSGAWKEIAGSGKVGDFMVGEVSSFSPFVVGQSSGGGAAAAGSDGGSGSGCFIATATFGTPMAREVLDLCRFRDTVLRNMAPGRLFVKLYETASPPVARFIEKHELIKATLRFALKPAIWYARFSLKAGLVTRVLTMLLAVVLGSAMIVAKRRLLI